MKYILSWTRDPRMFRWEAPDGDVRYCTEAQGLLWVTGTRDDIGRLEVECDLKIVETNGQRLATMRVPGSVKKAMEMVPADAEEIGNGGYHRLCWNNDDEVEGPFENKWRCCDELGDNEMRYVDSYRGLWYVDWRDHRAHLYHKGRMFRDPETNFGYLVPESTPREYVAAPKKPKKLVAV